MPEAVRWGAEAVRGEEVEERGDRHPAGRRQPGGMADAQARAWSPDAVGESVEWGEDQAPGASHEDQTEKGKVLGGGRRRGVMIGVEIVDLSEEIVIALAFCAGDAVFDKFDYRGGLVDD